MLLIPHTLTKARQLWHEDFGAHCEAMPLQARSRTLPAQYDAAGNLRCPARTDHYYVQAKAAPSTAKDLMSDLVFMSIRALERHTRVTRSSDSVTQPEAVMAAPALSVNCKQLGQRRSLSTRTIRTHLDRLLQLGAITRKVWHGTRANFELWINTKYLWSTGEPTGDTAIDRLHIGALMQREATKLPLSVAFETLETKKLKLSQGDKLLTPIASLCASGMGTRLKAHLGLETRATLTRNTGPQLLGTGQHRDDEKKGGDPAVAAILETAAAGSLRPAEAQQKEWVRAFWDFARPKLYPGQAFSDVEQQKACNAIWEGVYAGFRAELTLAEWPRYQRQALERVDLVAAWLARHPDHYLPAPYAQIVPGRGYFDRENPQGFSRTQAWWERRQRRIQAQILFKALVKAQTDFRNWRLKKGPFRELTTTKNQLFQQHESIIAALHDPEGMQQLLRLASGQPITLSNPYSQLYALPTNHSRPAAGKYCPQ